jgi:hypothetical protein
MEAAMLRSAMMVGVIALCCAGVAQSAEARGGMGHGGMGFSHGGVGFNRGGMGFNRGSFGGRGFARFQSPRFERRGEFFENRRFFANRRFFDRDRDDRFFFRDRFRFRDRFPFDRFRDRFPFDSGFGGGGGFGFGGGFPYYPYDTTYGGGYYPYASAAPPEGWSANAAPPMQVADLPPCRESSVDGVVILRGTACARSKP